MYSHMSYKITFCAPQGILLMIDKSLGKLLLKGCWLWPENTYRCGKSRFTAGLNLNKTGFDNTRKYVVICKYWNF